MSMEESDCLAPVLVKAPAMGSLQATAATAKRAEGRRTEVSPTASWASSSKSVGDEGASTPAPPPPLPPPPPPSVAFQQDPPPPRCASCDISPALRSCSACRSAFYCSPACQKLHWPSHRAPCKQSPAPSLSRAPAGVLVSGARADLLKSIAVEDVGDYAGDFLTCVDGFNEVKNDLDDVAMKHNLSRTDRFMSFGPPELNQGQSSLKELFDVAAATKPVFDEMIRSAVIKAGIDPDKQYEFADEDHGSRRFSAHSTAPLKGEARCVEKVANEYGGSYSRLVDVVRCTVVCASADELVRFMEAMQTLNLVRLKNRFATGCEMKTGYRDCNYSVTAPGRNGVQHICEVQVHLAEILALKGKQHTFYEYFREYFKGGSGAYEARMALLRSFGEQKGAGPKESIKERIVKIVNGDDVDSLEGLATMCDEKMMGNFKLLVHVKRKLLAIEEGKKQRDEREVLRRLNGLGNAMHHAGDLDKALPLFRRTLTGREQTLGKDHPDTLGSVNNLAALLEAQGKLNEALPLYRQALMGCEKTLGKDHPDTLTSVCNLAGLLKAQGKLDEALPLYRRALTGYENTLGKDHPNSLRSANSLAALLEAQGKLDEALPLYRQALTGMEQALGKDHPDTLTTIDNLAGLLRTQGKLDEALPLNIRALTGYEQMLGKDHPDTLTSANNLALLLKAQGKLDEALPLYRRALAGFEQTLGKDHQSTLGSVFNLASSLEARGKLDEALPLYRRAVETGERTLGVRHPYTIQFRHNLDALLSRMRR